MARVLIADDEPAVRLGIQRVLQKSGYELSEAENGQQVLERLEKDPPDLILLDLNMPECNGFETLKHLSQLKNKPLVIMMTAYGSEKVAVEAMKLGAFDYLRKPYEIEELRLIVKKALKNLALEQENLRLTQALEQYEGPCGFIGKSAAMMRVFQEIRKVAESAVTVLLLGENGTGKELAARAIHQSSSRKNQSFVPVNCAAMPDELMESELFGHEKGAFTGASETRIGKFEGAHHGTIFLDEVGDMSLKTQVKLLRVLEERKFARLGGNKDIEVDVRVISATNRDLEKAILEKQFREDLYYRLKVVDICLPPLRERKEDILLLIQRFGEYFCEKHHKGAFQTNPQALKALVEYPWPGNVRELRNLIERQIVLSETPYFSYEELPKEIRQTSQTLTPEKQDEFSFSLDLQESFRELKKQLIFAFEKYYIEKKLVAFKGNISQTAVELDMHRQSLQQKLKELGLHAKDYA
jgi:DNA-binding NtrC family response regulator